MKELGKVERDMVEYAVKEQIERDPEGPVISEQNREEIDVLIDTLGKI